MIDQQHARVADKIFELADKEPETYATAAAILIAAKMIVDIIAEASDNLTTVIWDDDDGLVLALREIKRAIRDRE